MNQWIECVIGAFLIRKSKQGMGICEMVAKQQQHMKEKTDRNKQWKNGSGKLTSPLCLLSSS